MFEHFTEPARTAIMEAQAEAIDRGDAHLGTEHLLIGLLREGTGLGAIVLAEHAVGLDAARDALDALVGPSPASVPADAALATIGIDLDQVQARLEESFGSEALTPPPTPYDDDAKQSLELAVAEAAASDPLRIGTGHELLGLLQVTEGLAMKILESFGVDLTALADEVRRSAELGA